LVPQTTENERVIRAEERSCILEFLDIAEVAFYLDLCRKFKKIFRVV